MKLGQHFSFSCKVFFFFLGLSFSIEYLYFILFPHYFNFRDYILVNNNNTGLQHAKMDTHKHTGWSLDTNSEQHSQTTGSDIGDQELPH